VVEVCRCTPASPYFGREPTSWPLRLSGLAAGVNFDIEHGGASTAVLSPLLRQASCCRSCVSLRRT
jgi:hypothetical protein